jgi:hypothetical protein
MKQRAYCGAQFETKRPSLGPLEALPFCVPGTSDFEVSGPQQKGQGLEQPPEDTKGRLCFSYFNFVQVPDKIASTV